MASQRSTVAIFGATGNIGKHITNAFLTEITRRKFENVILFTRQTTNPSSQLKEWQASGNATVRAIEQDTAKLSSQLKDVDIVVNAINSAGDKLRTQVVEAMQHANIKLYFPSEYGVDHTVHDFGHAEWDKKKKHFELTKKVLPQTQVCRVYAGLFLEDSIGPWFGFDTKNNKYMCYGSAKEKVSYTSMDDVGRAIAELALLPLTKVPGQVHLSGDLLSTEDIAKLMEEQSGQKIEIVELPFDVSKTKEVEEPRPDPSGLIRVAMGEGNVKHAVDAMGCNDELVNPHQSKWKWKTMADLAKETGGRPWADSEWK